MIMIIYNVKTMYNNLFGYIIYNNPTFFKCNNNQKYTNT